MINMEPLLFLKPILTTLLLPAASGPLLLLVLSLWAMRHMPKRWSARWPLHLSSAVSLGLWFISCPAVAVWLSVHALPHVSAVSPDTLKHQQVQAIVILGGGVDNQTPEYAGPNLSNASMARLLYGLHLARNTQLPMAFTGGQGWGGQDTQLPEAVVADAVLARLQAPALRWQENQSRDTRENASMTAALLKADGITRIALVTHAWHMPRSVRHFEATGLTVLPAPMGYIQTSAMPLLQWLPSGESLRESGWVIKEWLGIRLTAP